jgi:2-oxoisovalerate dehydrogenase E1 component beta subunit
MPSNPLDAYGLLLSAIEDPNPVLFLKPKALMRVKGAELIPGEPADEKQLRSMIDAPIGDRTAWKPRWPELEKFTVPIGQAKITREGTDITLVTYGRHVLAANAAADELAAEGKSVEVIDMRSLYPYDWGRIRDSIRKTRRVVFVNEDTEVTNFAEHLAYRTVTELFYEILARPRVVAAKNLPGIGLHPHLEEATVPQKEDVKKALLEVLEEVP